MTCKQCASDDLKEVTGELAIHFPGMENLERPLVIVFPTLRACPELWLRKFDLAREAIDHLETPA